MESLSPRSPCRKQLAISKPTTEDLFCYSPLPPDLHLISELVVPANEVQKAFFFIFRPV